MKINVQGYAEEYHDANQIVAIFDFKIKRTDFDQALDDGSKIACNFIKELAPYLNIPNDAIKTHSYNVARLNHYKEVKNSYNETEHILVEDGYEFRQIFSLKLDYSNESLTKLLNSTRNCPEKPQLSFDFALKNENELRNKLIQNAYNDAKLKAQAAAKAAELKELNCECIDFNASLDYGSDFDDNRLQRSVECAINDDENETLQRINDSYKPEQIKISLALSTSWLAK